MKQLAKFSVDRAITVFMAVIVVIIFGVVSFTNLTTDLFPSMNIPYSVVITTYPGASPGEVEDVVTKPIEETLATTTNIKQITSMSQENVSVMILEFNSDANMDSAVIEMRESLDLTMSSMPDSVGNPMIIKLNPDMMPIMQLSITKEGFTQQQLTTYVQEEVLPQIERVPGVASVSVSGAYESEIQVTLNQTEIDAVNTKLNAMYDLANIDQTDRMLLDKEMISNILQAQNFEFPVGYANVDGVNYLVRVGDELSSLDDIKNLKIFNFAGIPNVLDPIVVSLSDVADVEYVNANDKEYAKVNGENAISISIQKGSEFATTNVTDEVTNIVNGMMDDDSSLRFTVLLNQGDYINQATGSVSSNLLYGAILAVIVLFIFLRSARATTIVAISIPISLMFAIVLIYFTGITLNIVSLGGLALGIGMLVDNSIVVIENIFRLKKLGHSNREAAIEGTKQVAGAITASTITTISVFIPVVFIEGFIKEIFMQMALTIAYSLTASLIIALTLVPAISSRVLKEEGDSNSGEGKGITFFKGLYEKVLKGAFKFKYIVLGGVLLLFGGSIYLALTNGFEYFPASDEGQLTVSIANPTDAPLSYDNFVATLDSISEDFLANQNVDVVGISLGTSQGMIFGISATDSATANVVLKADRTETTEQVQNDFEELLTNDYPEITFDISGTQQQTEMLTGSGFQVEIRGYDLDVLKDKAQELATIMRGVNGVDSVDDGIGVPADEIKITVDKDKAMEYGLTTAQVMAVVANLLAGEDVTTTINVDGDMYDVYVYDQNSNYADTQYTMDEIRNLIVGQNFLNPLQLIKVSDIATVDTIQGFSTIYHTDGVRSVTVSATFDQGTNATFVSRDIQDAMKNYSLPSGYVYEIQGENEEVMTALNTLILAVLLGIVLIYMVMASQFQSLTYPFIIMGTIPLAFTGGFLILFFAGMPVSVVAAIGFIILVGVVVNNGIVLVDYTNQLRDQGMDVKDALIEAGKTRLRPIIMTALTTILALSTMALGIGDGAEMMQPMAVTTIGGMLYATLLTLVVVPIMYYLLTKFQRGIFSGLGLFVILVATIVLYVLYSYWYIIPVGVVLFVLLLLWYIWRRKAGEVRV